MFKFEINQGIVLHFDSKKHWIDGNGLGTTKTMHIIVFHSIKVVMQGVNVLSAMNLVQGGCTLVVRRLCILGTSH
jgi:hypothetical protein